MPQATKDIQRRIKSIGNTKKVTKAMEMVSAAKMRKATSSVLSSRSYADLAWKLVRRLADKTGSELHPLLVHKDLPSLKLRQAGKIFKVALVLITSNRGLCGGFNSQIIQKAVKYIKDQSGENVTVELVMMGKKGRDFMAKRSYQITADFEKEDVAVDITEIRPLAKLLIGDYLAGKFDKVTLAYTDFISTLVQKPRIIEILPLDSEVDEELGDVGKEEDTRYKIQDISFEYLFEPTPNEVLNDLLPRLLEMQIYQAILESNASEHSARMVAMRNASDAASDMIDDLTLVFNKARQASITAELADISGGRAAVE